MLWCGMTHEAQSFHCIYHIIGASVMKGRNTIFQPGCTQERGEVSYGEQLP